MRAWLRSVFTDPICLVVAASVAAIHTGALRILVWGSRHSPAVRHLFVDVWNWLDFLARTREGQMPYVDFWKEYPVGAGLLYVALSPFLDPMKPFVTLTRHYRIMAFLELATAVGVYLMARHRGRLVAWAAALLAAALPTALFIAPFRFEPVVVFLTLVGAALHLRGRRLAAAAVFSVGTWLKWYPALFLIAQETGDFGRPGHEGQWKKSLAVFVAVGLAFNVPFLALGWVERHSVYAMIAPYLFHQTRELYDDTLIAVVQSWIGPLPLQRWAGHLTGLGMLALCWITRDKPFAARAALIALAAMPFNRTYSPQFHLWFAPFVALVFAEAEGAPRWAVAWAWIALDVVSFLVYPITFTGRLAEKSGSPLAGIAPGTWTALFQTLVVLRVVAVLVLAVAVWRASREPAPA